MAAVSDEAGGGRGVYSIGAVARMLDVPAATIRNWEERYATVVPERSEGGHRLYSRDQVEQLRFVAAEVSRGLSAADAHRLLGEQGEAGQPMMSDGQSGGTRLLVLLAERDPVSAELQEFFLRTEGYDVNLAFAIGEAEEHWLESRPQLAIVELMISGGLGAELCRRLKQHDAEAVLAISVLEARDEALAAGADAFLQKPFDPLELVSTVKDLLGASALVAPPRRRVASGRAPHERRRGARPDPRRRSADERDQPDHRTAGLRKDDPLPAVRLRRRDRGAPCDLPLHGLRAVREDPPLRPDAQLLRSRRDRADRLLRGPRRTGRR